jgi:hypothetical protein
MHFTVYNMLNTNRKIKFKTFQHQVARSWTLEVQNPNKFSSEDLQWQEKQPIPRGPKQDPLPQAECQTVFVLKQTQRGQNCCCWRWQEEASHKRE